MKNAILICHLGRRLRLQAVAILSTLAAVLPVTAWAQGAEPSTQLTQQGMQGTSTVYVFNYPTVDTAGEQIVLSSALIAWTPTDREETDSIESIHIYCHATIGADSERPSTNGFSKEQMMLQVLPRRNFSDLLGSGEAKYVGRCIIIAPDYEGYGVTKNRPHPYLSQRLTAQQVLDAVNYGLKLYREQAAEKTADNPLLPIKKDWRTFGIGYSQGAAVTLAVQRLIEENGAADLLHYCGSICGDGPYDLIETMRYYFYDDGNSYNTTTDHRKGTSTYPIVVPLIVKGMCATHPKMAGYNIGDFLSQQLLDTGALDWIDSKEYTTADMGRMWRKQLDEGFDAHGRHYSPEQMAEMFAPQSDKVTGRLEKMFTPATFAYLNDPDRMAAAPAEPATAQQVFHRALADNSVATGWEPKHRIQFYHSRGDMVVPFGNYVAFRDAHPDGENQLYRINDTYSDSDHMSAAIIFFAYLCITTNVSDVFNWLCEGSAPTAISVTQADDQRRQYNDNNWYTLDGRCLTSKPTSKGVYIYHRKKVVIR